MSITKEQFILAVRTLIDQSGCLAMDAVTEVADKHKLDMDTVARIITYNQSLKSLMESQARDLRLLKPIPPKT